MKNKILKKLLAFILLISICNFQTLQFVAFALYPSCNKLNKNGQFEDETCAILDSVEKISNGKKFIKLNNVGRKSEYNFLFFDSSEIAGVLPNLTYNKNANQIINEKERQLEESNKDLSSKIYTTSVGGMMLDCANNVFKTLNLNREDGQRFLERPLEELRVLKYRIQNVAILMPLAVTAGLSTLVSNLVCTVKNYFFHKNANEFLKKSNVEYNNYFDTLRTVLSIISSKALNTDKILCLRLKSYPAVVRVLGKKGVKNIEIEDQDKFNKNISDLKEEILNILVEANELR